MLTQQHVELMQYNNAALTIIAILILAVACFLGYRGYLDYQRKQQFSSRHDGAVRAHARTSPRRRLRHQRA